MARNEEISQSGAGAPSVVIGLAASKVCVGAGLNPAALRGGAAPSMETNAAPTRRVGLPSQPARHQDPQPGIAGAGEAAISRAARSFAKGAERRARNPRDAALGLDGIRFNRALKTCADPGAFLSGAARALVPRNSEPPQIRNKKGRWASARLRVVRDQ